MCAKAKPSNTSEGSGLAQQAVLNRVYPVHVGDCQVQLGRAPIHPPQHCGCQRRHLTLHVSLHIRGQPKQWIACAQTVDCHACVARAVFLTLVEGNYSVQQTGSNRAYPVHAGARGARLGHAPLQCGSEVGNTCNLGQCNIAHPGPAETVDQSPA